MDEAQEKKKKKTQMLQKKFILENGGKVTILHHPKNNGNWFCQSTITCQALSEFKCLFIHVSTGLSEYFVCILEWVQRETEGPPPARARLC